MGKHNQAQKGRGVVDPRTQKQQDRMAKQQFRKNRQKQTYGDASWKSNWNRFSDQLAALNLTIKDVAGDGNCLFRAIADQIEGDPNRHAQFRQRIVDFIRANEEDYAPFIEDDRTLDAHLAEMSRNGIWGGHLEIHAASQIYNVNVCIHQLDQPRWEMRNHDGPVKFIHLSYHDGEHYSSVRRRDEPPSHTGPPLPIRLEEGIPWSASSSSSGTGSNGSGTSGKKQHLNGLSWEQDYISKATGCNNIKFIDEVLFQCNHDPEQAIEFIVGSAAATDSDYQRDFLLSAGIDPGDFIDGGASSSAFEDPYACASDFYDDDYQKHQGGKQGKKGAPKVSQNPYKGKKAAASEASSSSSSSSSAPVHPKLAKFQNQGISNKERQRMQREAKSASTQQTTHPAATPTAVTEQAQSSEPLPNMGSLQI